MSLSANYAQKRESRSLILVLAGRTTTAYCAILTHELSVFNSGIVLEELRERTCLVQALHRIRLQHHYLKPLLLQASFSVETPFVCLVGRSSAPERDILSSSGTHGPPKAQALSRRASGCQPLSRFKLETSWLPFAGRTSAPERTPWLGT